MRSCALCLSLLFSSAAVAETNWPQYRGPSGDGRSAATDLPISWSETENVKWKTPLEGKAWSSPVVWGEQVWVTNAPLDGKQLFAICLNAQTGKIEREIKVFEIAKPQYCIEKNSYATCTPVIEDGRIYVHFGAHGTACLDTKTGETLWSRQDLECNHHRGPASSPVLWGDLLYLTFDGFDAQYVAALDKKDGKTVWRSDRNTAYKSNDGDIKKAYSTPQIIDVAGKPQLVSPSAEAAVAYDPKSGAELWRVRAGGMNASCRPLFGNGLVYMTAPDGGMQLYAVKPDGEGDVTSSHVVWKQAKGVPKYASQILVGEHLFMSSEQGVLTSLDAVSGKVLEQQRVGGVFFVSPLYADGKLYFFAEDGKTTVTEATPELKVLATNPLADGFMASPAVTGKALILRTKKAVYRIEK